MTDTPPAPLSYRHAHWYFLAALLVTVAGFWPSFFARLGAGEWWHSLHGITATLWIITLATQSFLMSRGLRTWHRRVAITALVLLLPTLVASALYMIGVMQHNAEMPPFLPPFLAFIDLPSTAFLLVLVALGLANIRTPAAHKRFMAATVLLGFPPALTRLYGRVFADVIGFDTAFFASLFTVELILVVLIIADWRTRERRLAYPLSLAFFAAVHLLIGPVSATAMWLRAMTWYGSLPMFTVEAAP